MERVLSDEAQGWDKWQEEADRALRTTDSWEVGGPGTPPSPGPSRCLHPLPSALAEVSWPQQPTTGRAGGGSGQLLRPGCRRWAQRPQAPHMAATTGPPGPGTQVGLQGTCDGQMVASEAHAGLSA